MPFIPLSQSFPRVSAREQSNRDADAERLVSAEFEQDMPDDSRAALENEFQQRFDKEPSARQPSAQPRGFVPLANVDNAAVRGFIPLKAVEEPAAPAEPKPEFSLLKTIALENPLTAAGEIALNFGTQMVAMPVAGLTGLAAEAGHALGLTEKTGADVVHSVGGALTYQPRGTMGQMGAEAVTYPFQKLAEAGQWVGGKTLEATGSPTLATAVDTAINAAPMLISPAVKSVKGAMPRATAAAARVEPTLRGEAAPDAVPTEKAAPAMPAEPAPRFADPHELGVSAFTEKARQAGLNDAQIKELAPTEPRDAVTGFYRAEHRIPTVKRAQEFAEANDVPAYYVEADIANLGGLNDHFGNNHTHSNRVYRDIADIFSEEMNKAGDQSVSIRQGGDEINSVVIGGSPESVRAAIGNITARVRDYAEANGLSDIPHPKGKAPGVGLYSGFSEIKPGRALDDIFSEASHVLDQGKKESKNVRREQNAATDGVSRDERPGSSAPAGRGNTENQGFTRSAIDGRDGSAPRGQGAESPEARVSQPSPDAALPEPAAPKTARYALIEADDLKASHDSDLRPVQDNPFGRQDTPRYENEAAVQNITRDFDPARLGEALDDADGAPIVARDGIVESGHRRVVAMQRIYQANGLKADTYRQHLRENASKFGVDPGAIDGMSKPVLVRVPDQPAPRRATDHAAMPDDGTVNSFAPGASYTGFIDDTPSPKMGHAGEATPASAPAKASARPEPIRREDVLIPFIKALDTGIYEGRIKGKGKMGFFRPKTEEVRIKRHADLETASHEVAHLMDKRIPEIRKAWETDKALATELKSISYDHGKVYEGFAEGVRLWMTQPEVLQAKAPLFTKWFDGFVQRHEYGPAIKKAQEGIAEWSGQDAVDRARSKIGKHAPLSDALDGGWDKFRQSVVDDLHGVMRMEREKTGAIAPAGAYETARLARASHSIADGALRFGAPFKKADGSFGWKGKGLEEILKPIAHNLDDALLYFVGKSARELMTQGREHLFTPGEIDGMLRLKKPEFDQAFKEYQEWNQGVLDFAEAHGVINPEARALWQRTQYMPFQRIGQPGGFKGKPGDWSGVKALTGGTENIRDILGNMTSNAAQLIDKAVKNEARQKIAELSEKVEGGGKFMVKIPAESRPVKIDSRQVIDALLKNMGIDSETQLKPAVAKAVKDLRKELGDNPAMLELMQTNMPPAGSNVVAVLKAGKPTWYEVGDPLLYRALQSIDRPLQSVVVKWLGLPKRIGQMAITLTPDFMLANIARDTIMGSVMSRAGFRPVIDSLQGMRLRLTSDPIYREYIANGGGMSSMFLDETRFRAKLEKFYQRQGIDYRTVLDAPAKIGNFLETLADSFEMSTRLGEYKRAIDRGEHPRHAAYLGRDVSTDFAMKGDSQAAGFMYDTVMFLRPALVSWDRLYRGIAHDPNKMAIAAKTGTLALMSAALYLLNKDDPRYKDLQDWDRDSNWHFFIGDQHFRYPKIWEIGAVASVAERTTEKVINEDPEGLGKDFARILSSTFNLNWKPHILAPLYEQATNRSGFTQAPIETPGMENMQPFLRAKPTTSETMKALGMATKDMPESMQVNPVRAEALLRGYFNTWAMYVLMLTDKAMFGDKLPEMRADQMPVVRRFYSQEPPQHTKFETEFYDMLGEAKRLHGTLRQLDGMGRSDIADDKEKGPLATEAKPLERAAKNLAGINRDMLAVRRSDATPAEKREKLDALTVERNALLKAAVTKSKAAQGNH